jgi:hypothetical protein
VGVLVIRAVAEKQDVPRLLVRIVEVSLQAPDRPIAVVSTVPAALDVVRAWLDQLVESAVPGPPTCVERTDGTH